MKLCTQCGKPLNPVQVMLGLVCEDCCRLNHRRVVGLATDYAPDVNGRDARFTRTDDGYPEDERFDTHQEKRLHYADE